MLLLHRATVLFYIVNQAVHLFIHNVTFNKYLLEFLFMALNLLLLICFSIVLCYSILYLFNLILLPFPVLFYRALHLDILFAVLYISIINVLIYSY